MQYVAIYDKNETEYQTRRICFLENAKDVCITQSINGDYDFEFKLPAGDPKWKNIKRGYKAGYGNEIFRIRQVEGLKVSCTTLIQDACRVHLPYVEDMINKAAYDIFRGIFAEAEEAGYVKVIPRHEFTDKEGKYKNSGLEPVTEMFDFFEASKKTPIGLLNIFMEQLNKYRVHGEIFIDGTNGITLVKRLGKETEVTIDPRYNAKKIETSTSNHKLITRLYPYGKDDLPLAENANNGKHYIDSENIKEYGIYEGFCNFDEITDQDALLDAAKWQFSTDNPDRIDIEQCVYSIDMVDLNGRVNLGDTVTVNDIDRGMQTRQRVITIKRYPLAPHKNSIIVGRPPVTMNEAFSGMFQASQYLRLSRNGKQELKTPTLEFMEKNEDVTVENDGQFQKIAKYKTGALFVSPNGKYAVALIDGKIKIGVEDSTKADGWNWIGVFGHGEGDNEKKTYLLTNLITIMSENSELEIQDNFITMKDGDMKDGDGKLRFKAGYDDKSQKYVFELYDKNGEKNMYFDDSGNLTMRGVFKTGKDGEARTVIDGNGIQGYDDSDKKSGLWIDPSTTDLALYHEGTEYFTIYNELAGTAFLQMYGKNVLSLRSTGGTGHGTWKFNNGATGSFTTDDGKTVTVNGGLITGIS